MKAIETIREHIKRVPRGKPIVTASLSGMASPVNIRQALSRMVKAGKLSALLEVFLFGLKKILISVKSCRNCLCDGF